MQALLGCIVFIFLIALVFGALYGIVAALTYLACIAFGWTWSWMIALGVCAVICLIWFIFLPLIGGKNGD